MKSILTVEEVAELLKVSKGKAYAIIRQCNQELKEKGYITIQGKVNGAYLYERFKLEEA